jgi:pimeloyl-ACP methyl ester carboxylesterase
MGTGYRCFVQENQDLHITCPVLILVGESDKTGKVIAYCKAWHIVTGYPLQIIQNAAHNANYDNPDTVNTLIDAFVHMFTTDAQKT